MNNIRKLFLIICVITYLIPVYGQKDTITADGLYLKYNSPQYRVNGNPMLIMEEMQKDKDFRLPIPNDSDMIRGELNRETKRIGLTYTALPQYIISEQFGLDTPPNPIELLWTVGNLIISQWIHEDGECILFFKCSGMKSKIDKSIDKLEKNDFNWIKQVLKIGSPSTDPTEEEMQEIKKKITIWSPEKAKKAFNAQYVITYPIEDKKSVYMNKYTHKLDLMMIKWGDRLTVSFLVTKKGNKNIDKYIREVEEAFWFED